MKIRIGNMWFSSDDIPVLVEFDDQEKKDIGCIFQRISAFPESMYFSDEEKQDFTDGIMIRIGGPNE